MNNASYLIRDTWFFRPNSFVTISSLSDAQSHPRFFLTAFHTSQWFCFPFPTSTSMQQRVFHTPKSTLILLSPPFHMHGYRLLSHANKALPRLLYAQVHCNFLTLPLDMQWSFLSFHHICSELCQALYISKSQMDLLLYFFHTTEPFHYLLEFPIRFNFPILLVCYLGKRTITQGLSCRYCWKLIVIGLPQYMGSKSRQFFPAVGNTASYPLRTSR